MTPFGGIGAPETVPEGTSAPIEVSSSGTSEELIVTVIGTGETFTVKTDASGKGRFELPASAVAGELLVVRSADNPADSATIEVTPASRV